MKFPLIISIIACVLATYISASPTILSRYVARGLSEWGIGHYGGTVSEISKQEALELGKSIVLSLAVSRTITSITSASTIAAGVTEPSSNEEIFASWSSTYTTTITVTATITVIPTATILAKREEILILERQLASPLGSNSKGNTITGLNQSFRTHTITLGDPCNPLSENGEVDYKICAEGIVAICGANSLVWEIHTDCASSGLVCGAMQARGVTNKADVQCLGS